MKLRMVLTGLIVIACAISSFAQPALNNSGNISALNGCVAISYPISYSGPPNPGAAGIEVAGTFSGTVSFYEIITYNWTAAAGTPVSGGAAVPSTTGPGLWQFSTVGLNGLEACASSYASGTISISIKSTTGTVARRGSGSGTLSGATGATDNAILRADGTGGLTVQNSGITIDDSNNIINVNTISVKNVNLGGDSPFALYVAPITGITPNQTVFIQDAQPTIGKTLITWQAGQGQSSANDPILLVKNFAGDSNLGMYADGTLTVFYIADNAGYYSLSNGSGTHGTNKGLNLGSLGMTCWATDDTYYQNKDLCVTRISANLLGISTGSQGSFAGGLKLTNMFVDSLRTTGSAGSKKVVCVDTATGQLYSSSTGTDCSN